MSSDNQQHAARGPSGAASRRLCAGKAKAERGLPDVPNKAGIDGTQSHYFLNHCIKQYLASPHEFVGTKLIDPQCGEFTVDRERATRVAVCIDYVDRRIQDMADEHGPCAVRAEERADPGPWMGRDDVWGTADITLAWQTVLEVIDYKDGMHPVLAQDNDQLIRYALGRLIEYVDPRTNTVPFHTVRMTIVQPRREQMGESPNSWWEIPTSELFALLPDQIAIEVAADDPNAPRTPGDEQCRYCRAKPCDAYVARGLRAAETAFAAVRSGSLEGNAPAAIASPASVSGLIDRAFGVDVASLEDDTLEALMDAEDIVIGLFKSAREQANKRALAGATFTRWVLDAGRSSRKYSAEEVVIAKKLVGSRSAALGRNIRKTDVYEQVLLSPAKLETSGLLNKDQFKAFADAFIQKTHGQPRLARAESARSPVSAETAFAGVRAGALSKPPKGDALSLI